MNKRGMKKEIHRQGARVARKVNFSILNLLAFLASWRFKIIFAFDLSTGRFWKAGRLPI